MWKKGEKALSEDIVTPEEEIKDPYVLEFLDLKDEYSETDLEEALIRHLETFLLELDGVAGPTCGVVCRLGQNAEALRSYASGGGCRPELRSHYSVDGPREGHVCHRVCGR